MGWSERSEPSEFGSEPSEFGSEPSEIEIGRPSSDRAVAPVGIALLVGLAVVLAGVVASATVVSPEPVSTASLSISAAGDRITLIHRGGDPLNARTLRIVVTVEGVELDHQPPIPFFSADGFHPGPTGPFNSAADPTWTAGETASFRVAGTNAPTLAAGDEIAIAIYAGDRRIASLTTRVG